MKKTIFNAKHMALAAMALAMASCTNNKLTVEAQLQNTGDTIIVYQTANDDALPDTILVSEGRFSWQKKLDGVQMLYIVRPERSAIVLLGVPGEKVTLEGDMEGDYTIGGSKFYQEYDAQQKMLKEATQENVVELVMKYAREHSGSEAVPQLLSIIGAVAPDSLDSFLALIPDKVKNGRMKEYLDNQVTAVKAQIEEEAKAKALQAEGREVPDFTLQDINGKPFALSSLRGKYVILDFWGSWCGWCIKGFPQMKEYYQKYQGKFEILGIDCSDSDEDWKKAVKEHELPWLHVYNPEDSAVLGLYGIQGFPTKIIVDPEGKIVKTIVGEDPAFYTLLDELFGK